jgi:hypothetical protein
MVVQSHRRLHRHQFCLPSQLQLQLPLGAAARRLTAILPETVTKVCRLCNKSCRGLVSRGSQRSLGESS